MHSNPRTGSRFSPYGNEDQPEISFCGTFNTICSQPPLGVSQTRTVTTTGAQPTKTQITHPFSFSDSSFNGATEEEEDTSTFRDSLSQDSIYNFNFSSSQDSFLWSQFDSDSQPSLSRPPPFSPNPRSKKSKNLKLGQSDGVGKSNLGTSTLMEAQEFGEMMEHVDEVNFAFVGLRKGHPPRIHSASLLSFLSICEKSDDFGNYNIPKQPHHHDQELKQLFMPRFH